ncbi:hypothetical protein BDZ45DRAFT_808801 [Acephala macrosclerotiorum]|nr:hypothetical protein BDZ45DRAFT_808801 [Acephala macrosclerotiorum]
MQYLRAAIFIACFTALANAKRDSKVCNSLWVTIWGDGERCAETYVSETDTYTLATPYQIMGSMSDKPTATTPPPTSPTYPIIGALCSSTNKCPTGQCCGKYGYCGSTIDYCGAGCYPDAGLCWSPSGSLAPPIASEAPASTPPSPPPPPPITNIPSATVDVIPSASPTWIPCTSLADFYVDSAQLGAYYHACGYYGVCQNVDPSFVGQASSMYFSSGTSYCDLYASADCGAGNELVIYVNDAAEADFSSASPSFNDQLSSFKCFGYIL